MMRRVFRRGASNEEIDDALVSNENITEFINAEGRSVKDVLRLISRARDGYAMRLVTELRDNHGFFNLGFKVKLKASSGSTTALHFAAIVFDNEEVINFLVNRGADIHARDCHGRTPSGCATVYGNERSRQVLESYLQEAELSYVEVVESDVVHVDRSFVQLIREEGGRAEERLIEGRGLEARSLS